MKASWRRHWPVTGPLRLFQQLREPDSEALGWHNLGVVFEKDRNWDEAERRYRESAGSAKNTTSPLRQAPGTGWPPSTAMRAGWKRRERWYRKAIEGEARKGDTWPASRALNNLANLLQTQPDRLAEARQLAEKALALSKTLHPGTTEIWTTYDLLAYIAVKEAALTADSRRQAELQAEPGTPPSRSRSQTQLLRHAAGAAGAGAAGEPPAHLRGMHGSPRLCRARETRCRPEVLQR